MNDSRPAAGAPSLFELQSRLDKYVDDEDIFHIGLMLPAAAPRVPGDRLDRAWTAFRKAALRLKREVLRARDPDADLQDWEVRVEDAMIPMAVEAEYQSAYLAACPTRLDRHIAFAEYMVNTRLVHAWHMYMRCCLFPLIDMGVETMKTHVGYLRYEEQQYKLLEFQRWVALRKIARFIKAHPRTCVDCRVAPATSRFHHLDGRTFRLCAECFLRADHEEDYLVHRIRIRTPPTCSVCADRATHTFTYKWGSDPMCRPCYEASCEEAEEAARHNAYRSCPHPPSECEGDCGIMRCGCWEGECECYKRWGRD
jgi:hypothetical protein